MLNAIEHKIIKLKRAEARAFESATECCQSYDDIPESKEHLARASAYYAEARQLMENLDCISDELWSHIQ